MRLDFRIIKYQPNINIDPSSTIKRFCHSSSFCLFYVWEVLARQPPDDISGFCFSCCISYSCRCCWNRVGKVSSYSFYYCIRSSIISGKCGCNDRLPSFRLLLLNCCRCCKFGSIRGLGTIIGTILRLIAWLTSKSRLSLIVKGPYLIFIK